MRQVGLVMTAPTGSLDALCDLAGECVSVHFRLPGRDAGADARGRESLALPVQDCCTPARADPQHDGGARIK